MEASIRDPHIRNFVRLLQCASKFGDNLNIHANKDSWELAVNNSTKSAFCLFKLKHGFFCRYKALGSNVQPRKGIKCQLLVKSVLAVLGKSTSITNVQRIDLTIFDPEQSLGGAKRKRKRTGTRDGTKTDDEEEYEGSEEEADVGGIESKLIMKLVCRHGVTKKHSLHLASTPFLRAEVDPDSTPSSFKVTAKALRDILDHFAVVLPASANPGPGRGENQLGWMFGHREVRLKSWEGVQTNLCTEITVDSGEFEDYWLEGERVDLTLPMREFRAALMLAEQISTGFLITFSEPGQPLTLTAIREESAEDHFDMFCAIATTTCDAFATVNGLPDVKGRSTTEIKSSRTSSAVPPPGGQARVDESSGGSRTRSGSEVPGKRKRSTLSMSTDPAENHHVSVVYNTTSGSQCRSKDGEPLFLPHSQTTKSQAIPRSGSQSNGPVGEGQEAEEVPMEVEEPRPSQNQRMTQKEVLEVSGFGDIHMDDLVDELDFAEEDEEEDEMEEEQRASQVQGGNPEEEVSGLETGPRDLQGTDQGKGGELEEDEMDFPATQSQSGKQFKQLFDD